MDFNGALENGVELYTSLDPKLNGFCLSLWVRRGSMHEPRDRHGLAHFLEHVLFRAISERMGGRLYEWLIERGLDFDACTYANYVRFEISGVPEAFEEALELLLKVPEPPELSLEGLDRERRRVLAEIREEDAEESGDGFANAHVWRGTPLARSIAGRAASVNRIGFDSLREEHARWFSRGNFFFCATGSVPDLPGLKARLSALTPTSAAAVQEDAAAPAEFFHRGAGVVVQERYYGWARFCFDVATDRASEMALMLLLEYLLGDMGKLYLALSEDTGLTYNLDDYCERCANVGNLCFDFEVEPNRLYEAVDVVVDALNAAKDAPDADLLAARQGFLRGDVLKQDGMCAFNNTWGFDNGLKHCGFVSPEARRAAYRAVEPEDVRRLAREIFTPDNALMCVRAPRRCADRVALRERLMRLK